MKKTLILIYSLCGILSVGAQKASENEIPYQNTSQRLTASEQKLSIGGYAQIDYNQSLSEGKNNGTLDVHRLVMLFGYRFNDRTNFITEIEYEHVEEVYVEQAFLQYKISSPLQFRAGLLLTPMGIINEYHEPPTYNGVERPLIDNVISPTTWREIGAGFTGDIIDVSFRYQAYVMNGFKSYDEGATLSGKNGLRKGRQKGAESFSSYPNLALKAEYYGIRNLNLGLSGYFGKTSSTLYNEDVPNSTADSSVVGISMIGADARYNRKGFQLRGQVYYISLSNTNQYNEFTANNDKLNDVGSSKYGYYLEAAYDLFHSSDKITSQLIPFVRFSQYDTHAGVEANIEKNEAYHVTAITSGLGWKITTGAMLKADVQFVKPANKEAYEATFNAGVAIMF